ncbi:uncharacterized protein B0H64DRAFT_443132 [Chaetomium fimeti]|uniref:Uncharacterized protein n=1 Tax=Chaetomium fimeti TaxID=1854472 RepID=A0AAE0HD24_9PEZI|nr:hypothetical protein B0H64DRAFT_443132 [Chaetomium fimeti]
MKQRSSCAASAAATKTPSAGTTANRRPGQTARPWVGIRTIKDHPSDVEPPLSAKAVTWKPPPGDQEEQAKAWYDEPTRARSRLLETENLRLKKLLREHGISWNPW